MKIVIALISLFAVSAYAGQKDTKDTDNQPAKVYTPAPQKQAEEAKPVKCQQKSGCTNR